MTVLLLVLRKLSLETGLLLSLSLLVVVDLAGSDEVI